MLIYWIRNDFRFKDNEALFYFSQDKGEKKLIYIYDESKFTKRSAQKWWLYKTLTEFRNNLEAKKYKFEFFTGLEEIVFKNILNKQNLKKVIYNKIYLPDEEKIEKKIIKLSEAHNVDCNAFSSNLLMDPRLSRKKDDTPFQVFTPFWKNEELKYLSNYSYKNHNIINTKKIEKTFKEFEKILPKKKWYKKFEKYWKIGSLEAEKKISNFINNNIEAYDVNRDIPSLDGTSKLSPHLAFGEISSRDIYDQYLKLNKKNIGCKKFINEIGWREFAYHLINHFPHMKNKNLRKNFDKFPWSTSKTHLQKWKKGETGYPIIDAAMKQLYETGWMHNRLRMVTGSFLVKHLRINWVEGEKYFQDTLIDYDAANNVAGWQWIAGCGADAAPYFRIFNPMTQGEKFDKNGDFVRKWLPRLKTIPNKYIHKPWEMPKEISKLINFDLKRDYFEPIVDHSKARNEALKAFEYTKK